MLQTRSPRHGLWNVLRAVQLMITVSNGPEGTLVKVDGWLSGDGVAELSRVLDAAASPMGLLLHDLRGADDAGLSLLRRLAAGGVPLAGLSTYIQLMLANPGSVGPLELYAFTRPETPVRSNET